METHYSMIFIGTVDHFNTTLNISKGKINSKHTVIKEATSRTVFLSHQTFQGAL